MGKTVKVASIQTDVMFGAPDKNLELMTNVLCESARQGVHLTVFPECTLAGYAFESLAEAETFAEPVPGPSTSKVAGLCAELSIYTVIGLLETAGDRIFNSCVLIGPKGLIGTYRKIHLPLGGVDRFTTPGDRPFGVWDAGDIRVGISICYDCAFPESARVMALKGADLILLPSAWPTGCGTMQEATFITQARAFENHVYYLSAARVGLERGVRYIGHSMICDPEGAILASAPHAHEAFLVADVDPSWARRKKDVDIPGKHEIDRFVDRRPQMYQEITEVGQGFMPTHRHAGLEEKDRSGEGFDGPG